jgi:transposase
MDTKELSAPVASPATQRTSSMSFNHAADPMNIVPQLERACGIDIHKEKVVVYFYIRDQLEQVKEYDTFTCDLEQMRKDIQSHEIKKVIMESTGVYWIALCAVLTMSNIDVCVVNPKFVKNMPKEKTDKKDARWLCKIFVNGLVRNSFVVSEAQRAFRDLCRMRTKYSEHITQSLNRVLKNLERRNIKLRSVVSNMDTQSARDIVNAIANGESDNEKLVALCKGKLKKKKDLMRKALHGVITPHDRMMLKTLMKDVNHFREQIAELEKEIAVHVSSKQPDIAEKLQQVKGIGPKSTEIILAEIGDNVKPFATPDKLAAWVGLAPGNKETGGVKKYAGTRDGNKYLRTTMLQVAWAAVRTKGTYWRALYYQLTKRMPMKKAIVAVARKLIRVIYKIIKGDIKQYVEYGEAYFYQRLQIRLAQKTNHSITLKTA